MAMGTGTLANLANNRCGVRLNLYPDTQEMATGVPVAQVECTPSYVSSVSYNFPTDGNFTEDVTIVSNDKTWATTLSALNSSPAAISPTGVGILRRGLWSSESLLPNSGSVTDGTLSSVSGGIPAGMKIQSVKVSMNLGREQIRELGRRTPFYRYIKFPVEITSEIECVANTGDMVGVAGSTDATCNNPKALSNKQIVIKLCDGTVIDLGKKNKLTSVNYTGGDTGGGNATITYSYQTYNDFSYVAPTAVAYSNVVEVALPVPGADF
jgi:hypothetical protein